MSDALQWAAIIVGEIFLLFFVLLLIYWFINSAKKRKDAKAVEHFVAKVGMTKLEREEAIREFLSDNMHLAGKPLEKQTKKILREEMRLLQTFANTYKNRDAVSVEQFQLAYEQSVGPYYELKAGGAPASSDLGADDSELEALRKENIRLSEELQVTMETMSRMLEEYSTMFDSTAAQPTTPDSEAATEEVSAVEEAEPELISEAEVELEADEGVIEESAQDDDALDDIFDMDNLDNALDDDPDDKSVAI